MNRTNNSNTNLVLELGDKCNNNCIFCSVKYKQNHNLSTKKLKKSIIDAKARGFKKIHFSGGEPTIRKDFLELIKYAKENDFTCIGLSSNARLLSYQNLTKKLVNAGCNYFSISIHGPNASIHDSCTRTPGSFEQTIRGLKNILKLKTPSTHIQVTYLLNKLNINYLDKFVLWINSNFKGVDMIALLNMHPIGEAQKHQQLMFKLKNHSNTIDTSIQNSQIPVIIYDVPLCSLKNVKSIEKKGGLYKATGHNSTKNLRNSIDFLKTKFPFCKCCDLNGNCTGIWKSYLKKFGNGEFKPIIKNKKSIYLEVTKRCNQRCLFCVKSPFFFSTKDHELKDLKKVIAGITNPKNINLVFDGGEPTYSPNFLSLISFARKHNIKNINILTNGVRLADNKLLSQISDHIKKGINISFCVSIHSHIKKTSEKLVGTKNTFEKTIKGIKNLSKKNIPFGTYTVMNKYNVDALPNLVKFIAKYKPESMNFAYVWHSGKDSLARKNKDVFFKISEKGKKIKEAIDECKKNKIKVSWSGCGIIPFCLAKGYESIILKNIMAERDSKFVANEEGLTKFKLLSSEYANMDKHKKKECALCKYDALCQGIWKLYVVMFGDEELKPIKK